ncbi:MAG: T9SS type A sorting domain-containing protein [Bacteroidota bacterium]
MKKLAMTMLLALMGLSGKAQTPTGNCAAWAWSNMGISLAPDEGNAICSDESGNVYVTGFFRGAYIQFGSITLTHTLADPNEIYVVKYNANGVVQWAVHAGSIGTNGNVNSICADKDPVNPHVYITGTFKTSSMTFYNTSNSNVVMASSCYSNLPNATNSAIFTAQLNQSDGNFNWAKSACGNDLNTAQSICAKYETSTSTTTLYVAGTFEHQLNIPSSPNSMTLYSEQRWDNSGDYTKDIFILSYDEAGSCIWASAYGGDDDDEGQAITTDGFFLYLTGDYSSQNIFTSLSAPLTNPNRVNNMYVASIFSTNGNLNWAKTSYSATGSSSTTGKAITYCESSKSVYITGSFNGNGIIFENNGILYNSTQTSPGSGQYSKDMFAAKYDDIGTLINLTTGGGTGDDIGYSICCDNYGHTTVVGSSVNISNFYFLGGVQLTALLASTYSYTQDNNGDTNPDYAFLARFSPDLSSVICSTPLASGGDDVLSVCSDMTGNLYLSGDFRSYYYNDNTGTTTNQLALPVPAPTDDHREAVFAVRYDCGTTPVTTVTSSANSVCNGGSVTLTASGADLYCFHDMFGYNFNSNIAIVSPTTATTYTVIGTNSIGCSSTATITITVNGLPTVTASASPLSTFCIGNSVTLTASGNATSYTWSGGVTDGVPFTPSATETYTVTGTNANGCSNTASVTVTVNNPQVTANASSSTVCIGTSVTLTGVGATSYSWTGGVTDGIAFTPSATETYTVTGTDGIGCSNTASITITVNNPPVTANATALNICPGMPVTLGGGGATTFYWTGGVTDGVPFTPSATETYTVTGTDGIGCSNTASITITINNPPVTANASSTAPICSGSSTYVILTGGGALNYSWTGGVLNGLQFIPSATNTYTVTGTDGIGCSNTASITITVNALPTVGATASTLSVCSGSSVTLTGTGANSYSWTGGVSDGVSFIPTSTDSYTVTGTDGNGCISAASVTVIVNPTPTVTITNTGSTTCADGTATAIETSGSGTYSYLWNDATAQTTPTANHLPAGIYSVTVTNTATTCTATATTTVVSGMATDYPNEYTITGTETWNSTTTITCKGRVVIADGGTLIIDATRVEFGYDVNNDNDGEPSFARFQVNSGGTLIVKNGSVLTGCGGGIWDGIEVRGTSVGAITGLNYGLFQSYTNGANNIIENAKVGVVNDRRICVENNITWGGIIQAENTDFNNNRLGAELNSNSGASYFKNCNFNYNASTLFTYPATPWIKEWNASEMTFVHLKNGQNVKFQGNYFKTNTTDFADTHLRGTGIKSESASYTLQDISGSGPGNNSFIGLTKGIDKGVISANIGQLIAEGNTFDNVQQGITDEKGSFDELKNNTFNSIPTGDNFADHTYGIFMISSDAFDISNNHFNGSSSTTPSLAGSHGIVFENSGAAGGECYANDFKGTDYAIHTQDDNQALRIRCNQFAIDGNPHNATALYVEAIGTSPQLRQQGSNLCLSTQPTPDASQAAGNKWNSSCSGEQAIMTGINFYYYANSQDAAGNFTTIPSCVTSSNLPVVTVGMGLYTNGVPATSTSCGNEFAGIVTDGGNNNWINTMQNRINSDNSLITYAKQQIEILKGYNNSSLKPLIEEYQRQIAWYISENQLMQNKMKREFIKNNMSTDLLTLILSTNTTEAKKALAEYYLQIKDYDNAKLALLALDSIASLENSGKDSLKTINDEFENFNFKKYMNVIIDLYKSGRKISELTGAELNLLYEVVNAKVKISAAAETLITLYNNEKFVHPIKKDTEKRMIVNRHNNKPLPVPTGLLIYPNPTQGNFTLEFNIDESVENPSISVFDMMGKIAKTMPIIIRGPNKLTLNCDDFSNGVYTCKLMDNTKVLYTNKLIIIK